MVRLPSLSPSAVPPNGRQPAGTSWSPDRADILDLLRQADFVACEHLLEGSNYTFLARLRAPDGSESYAVYKPGRGEAPLFDFPAGTLYRRECAAYVVSRALGWQLVPPTILRDGPYGDGSVQLFIESNVRAHYFTFGADRAEEARRLAAFDCAVNNADRKAGHCLLGLDGRVWGVDHGLTFHHQPKLRTVIWDYAGEPIPAPIVADFRALHQQLATGGDAAAAELRTLVSRIELDAFLRRLDRIVSRPVFPSQSGYRSVPWPLV
ncbi:MAG: SCO1664 family protein [Chloroflexi bacterium]|nr:SCO1664 family protein [Chloroflexota bacterium]